ncbi:MAG TPA: helix-turn-helix domain-containing protein [Candidatus Dojkabacteria bacterium]|nr:helix-turn-helix domain-containing protein [Candidatus Dojkabacteria bacterium]
MTIQEEIFQFWDDAFKNKFNSAIYTIPGLGGGYMGQLYSNLKKINYINNLQYKISEANIVNLDLLSQDNIKLYNQILVNSQNKISNRNCSFIINNPTLFKEENQAEFQRHIYQIFWMRAKNLEETKFYINELNINFTQSQINEVYELSGGIPRLIKFLCFNKELLGNPIETICANQTLNALIQTTIDSIKITDNNELKLMNLINAEGWKSKIVDYLIKDLNNKNINITINKDLSFLENDTPSKTNLTVTEKEILLLLIQKTTISRDDISEIKWGKDEDQKFSYWAINKTITRLNSKLEKYIIKPLYKSGYTICPRN